MEKERPRLGCATIVRKENSILLGVRAKEPNRGKWVIPGGGVEFGEALRTAARREIFEETSLDVEIKEQIGVYELIEPPVEHRVIIFWWGDYNHGKLKPSSDLSDVKFFTKDEVKELIRTGSVSEIVKKVLTDVGWG